MMKGNKQLVEGKIKHKKLSLEDAYKDIIGSSSGTRKSVNEKLGLD